MDLAWQLHGTQSQYREAVTTVLAVGLDNMLTDLYMLPNSIITIMSFIRKYH